MTLSPAEVVDVLRGPRTAASLLAREAARRPEDPLVHARGVWSTVGEVHDRATAAAVRLVGRGVRPGDVVATALRGTEAVVALFAVELAGAIELPLPAGLPADRTGGLLDGAGCRLLLSDAAALRTSPGLQGAVRAGRDVVVLDADLLPGLPPGTGRLADSPAGPLPSAGTGPLDAGLVLSTSGTTGPPKAVVLPRAAGVRHARRVVATMAYGPGDVLLNAFPWHHVNVRHAALLPALLSGARLVVEDGFSASDFWGTCRRHGVTAFNFMGAMAAILLRTPASPVGHRVSRAYGGPAPERLVREFAERFGVSLLQAYACTELGDVATNTPDDDRPGSAGRPVPEYELSVVDPAGDPVPTGTVGRIAVRPRAEGLQLLGHLADGVLHPAPPGPTFPGDLGRLDEDGRLWFCGRDTDSVRRRGEHVSAWQVEQVLAEIPGVVDVAVVGVPSELTEEEVLAVLTVTGRQGPDAEAVWRHAAARLPRHEVPRWLRFTPQLPRNASQKVDKAALRALGTAGARERVVRP